MTENDPFKDQKKVRKAKIVTPPNAIKEKVGSGGLDTATIAKAEAALENNTVDFKPLAGKLLTDLDKAVEDARKNPDKGEAAIEALLHPAAQFKAQGTMFHFPLVSETSDILINFLETIATPVSEDALEIVTAHRKVLTAIINSNMTGATPPQGEALKRTLIEACERYYKKAKS